MSPVYLQKTFAPVGHYHCSPPVLSSVFPVFPGVWLPLWPPAAPSFHFSQSSPHLPSPSLPEEGAHCALPSIRLVIGRSGAVGEDCVGLGSFPCSDYPSLLSGNEPLPLGAFAAPSSSSHFFPVLLHSLPHSVRDIIALIPFFPDLVTSPLSLT